MKELNIDNVVEYITKNNLNTNNLVEIDNYFKNMIIYFYGNFELKKIKNTDGNFVPNTNVYKIKDNNIGVIHKNIYRITFLKLYPHIIVDLYNNNEINFSNDNIFKIYEFLLNNEFKLKKNINDNDKKIINVLLNLLYALSPPYEHSIFCKFSDSWKVLFKLNEIIKNLCIDESNLITYNTDVFYFKNINKELINKFDSTNLPYMIEDNINGIFLSSWKHILDVNNKFETKSISFKQNIMIQEYKEKLLNIRRYNKLNKLNKLYENK